MLTLTVDIETIPGPTPPDMQELNPEDYLVKEGSHPKSWKDEDKIKDWYTKKGQDLNQKYLEDLDSQKVKQHDLHAKQSLDSLQGQIICIGYKLESNTGAKETYTEVCMEETEEKTVTYFSERLTEVIAEHSQYSPILWVGHNLASFDVPYLYHKAIKHNLALKRYLPRSKADYFDTMKEWAPTDYNRRTSLKKIAQFLDIPQSGVDGSQVWDMWKEGKHKEIGEYCLEDVEITNEVYKRLK